MLLLGHVGITFGVAFAAESIASRHTAAGIARSRGLCARWRDTMASLSRRIDLRVLLIGSLLPDIIDKPLGFILLAETYGTGRLFSHALIFPVALAIAGFWLYRTRSSTHLLVLAYGTAMHLLLDSMWRMPSTLLWPFAGPMPRDGTVEGWLAGVFHSLLTNPSAYLPEIAGAILLVPLVWAIALRGGPGRFVRSGAVN